MRTVVVVFGVVGMLVAVDPGAAQQSVSAAGSPSVQPAKPQRVVNLKNGSFVIDVPGDWVLNRNWRLEPIANSPLNIIDVVADDVTLDFRGFEIEVEVNQDAVPVTVVNVQGDDVTVLNPVVSICCGEQSSALHSTGGSTEIDGLRGFSLAVIRLDGGGAVIRNSAFRSFRGVVVAGSSATIENTFISCGRFGSCPSLANDSKLLNSRIGVGELAAIRILGNHNLVAGNIIEPGPVPFSPEVAIQVAGDANVVRDNTLAPGDGAGVVVNVAGTGNVIDGNIGDVSETGGIGTGIRFEQNGNFYGDNRMDAAVPFDLGGTTQTDWGGNVGY